MPRLLAAAPHQYLHDILRKPFPAVHTGADQETVASLAIVNGIAAVPVVDGQQRLLGVVPPQALLEVLRHEHVEDLHRFVSIRHYTLQARTAMEAPPIRRARDRLPWLLVGLMGGMLATYVMTRFENALQSHVAIAFFVPGLVYLADAIGTQTEAITVRGLSLSNATMGTMIAGELRTGLIIGLTLGRANLSGYLAPIRRCAPGPGGFSGAAHSWIRRNQHRLSVSLDILPFGQRPRLGQRPACHHLPERSDPDRLLFRGQPDRPITHAQFINV
jgi:Mg/Co/Ni transporter MgtE